MPEDIFLQLIAAAFHDRAGAPRALDAVLRAREGLPLGILDAAAVTRAEDGSLLLQCAAEPVPGGGFAVLPLTGVVLAVLGGAAALEAAPHPADLTGWRRAARLLKGQLRDVSLLLTPASSVLVTIVGPRGAAEVAGVVLDEAVKLAVEDLPRELVLAMADQAALVFTGEPGAAVQHGSLPAPHPAFAVRAAAARPAG